jgi:cellulose synthase/poly-beta-1,6-N-acetylglucosamine synthase-like glycosyltransferase
VNLFCLLVTFVKTTSRAAVVSAVLLGMAACAGGLGGGANTSGNNNNSVLAIVGQPANQTVAVGQTVTFSVAATGNAPLNMQDRIDISVVIPTRSRPELLKRAIRSVAAQTVSNIEIIVVIDGPDEGR